MRDRNFEMENVGLSEPKVSIIILNWNGLEDTIECLESLRQITYPNYGVIIVDNGSFGNDAQMLKEKFGDYIFLIENDKNYGYAGGVNIGIKYALNNFATDYILLLNNDTVVDPEFLTKMVEALEGDPSIGIVGPAVYYSTCTQGIGKNNKINKIKMWIALIGIKQISDEGGAPGCCQLIKKDVIKKIGFFDESYFCYFEDRDYDTRARAAGYKIVSTPAARIWHGYGHTSQKVSGLLIYFSNRNKIRFMRKHATRWQYKWFMMYNLFFYFELMYGYHLILKLDPQAALSGFRGVRDGLLNRDTAAKLYGDNRF